MEQDRRLEFIEKWRKRGAGTEDPFDQFFCFWIALIVAAQVRMGHAGGLQLEDDREKVIWYLKCHDRGLGRALQANPGHLTALSRRRGKRHAHQIIETGDAELREHLRKLSSYFQGKERLSSDEVAIYLGELINKIRNNLFRGHKIYDDRPDVELLGHINPILRRILVECEGAEPS